MFILSRLNGTAVSILIVIAIGVWILVFQNFGVFGRHKVYVGNEEISVSVDNTVDVNLQKINGRSDVFFNNPKRGDDNKYYLIPVTIE